MADLYESGRQPKESMYCDRPGVRRRREETPPLPADSADAHDPSRVWLWSGLVVAAILAAVAVASFLLQEAS